jgi:hypothetical protein
MTQTYKDVIPHEEALFQDKIAQELNVLLFDLGHIDDLYGVCQTGIEEDETFPYIYINDGEKLNLRVLPDSSKSMSFYTVEGEWDELDELDVAITMGYIAWMNLQKIGPGKKYDFTNEILRDVLNVIKGYGGYDFTVNVTDPLSEFSMLEGKASTMRPYSAFKITFTKNIHICDGGL